MIKTQNIKFKYIFLIILFLLLGNSVFSQIANNQFTSITLKDGLSQSTVFAITQDSKGFMWFATHDGLNRYDGYNFAVFKNDKNNTNSISGNIIYSICQTKDSTLWIGTNGDGLNKFDNNTEIFTHYYFNETNPNSISQNVIRCIYEDSDGDLWIGTDRAGLNKMDRENGTFIHYKNNPDDENSIVDNKILDICMDKDDKLWIATAGGISIFDKGTKKFTTVSLGENPGEITDLFVDSDGTMWIATNLTGFYQFNNKSKEFKNYCHDENDLNTISHNSITKIYEDRKGVFWITTSDGLNIFNKQTEICHRYKHDPSSHKSLISNNIASVYEDNSGIIWLGCYEQGDLINFNPKTNEFQYYTYNLNSPNSISSNSPTAIFRDSKNNLWIGTWNGGLNKAVFNTQTSQNKLQKIDRFIRYKNVPNDSTSISSNSIQKIFEDKKGRLWIGTSDGLNIYDEKNDKFIRLMEDNNGNPLLNSNSIQSAIDSDSSENIALSP